VTANDNASYWQGYLGYPILAVLLARGELHADPAAMTAMGGVPWHDLNERFKRDYEGAVTLALSELAGRGGDPALVERQVTAVLEQLDALGLQRAGRGRRPPAARR
jgi:hypothetical protein